MAVTVPYVENFRPVRDILPLERLSAPVADPTLTDPSNAAALIDGEWMTLDANYKLVRACDVATAGNEASLPSFPLWTESGRFDVQATAERLVTVIWMGAWEFETLIFDAAADIGLGDPITTRLQLVKVASITISGKIYSGLVGATSSDTNPTVGRVTRLPADNGGWLRIRGGSGY